MQHDHEYLHEHNIPHVHHPDDVHDEAKAHLHSHEHAHDHAHGAHPHVHENTKAVLNRLSRAIGHLESVKKMVENGRDCSEVLIQIAAVRSAINNIGKVILQDHIQHCLVDAVENDDEQALDDLCQAIDTFIKYLKAALSAPPFDLHAKSPAGFRLPDSLVCFLRAFRAPRRYRRSYTASRSRGRRRPGPRAPRQAARPPRQTGTP